MNLLLLVVALSQLTLFCAQAAEPEATPDELPRIRATDSDKALATFQVKPGFKLELAAAEPDVLDPVAMAFDERGALYVVEMRDYSERRPERLGRIRRLVDSDGDGRFETSTVYAEGLPWPTAVICFAGGVFVGSTPDILFFKDTNGDGVSDHEEVVFTGFASDYAPYATNKLNVQSMMNTFLWGLDNRIHVATGGSGGKVRSLKRPELPPVEVRGKDFSFDPRNFSMRAESGGAQHGMSFDDAGNKYVCSNSDHIQQVLFEDQYGGRNPQYAPRSPRISIAVDGPAAEVYRISPDEPWRVIRTRWRVTGVVPGLIEGGGRPSGYFTGATGTTIYRGDAWPESMRGNAFVADCGSNLIHRKRLLPERLIQRAERPPGEERIEFIASSDNWFRPVQFANAPDGTLYVADMYREVIEHPWSLPAGIKKHLDLNSGHDRGRIYRIAPEGFKNQKPVDLGQLNSRKLVGMLEHPNGWHRDTASRLLFERADKSVLKDLEKLLEKSSFNRARLHALRTLAGLGLISEKHLFWALGDVDPDVRRHGVQLCETASALSSKQKGSETVASRLARLARDPEATVRYQVAFSLGSIVSMPLSERISLLGSIALRDSEDQWFRNAIFTSLKEGAPELFSNLLPDRSFSNSSGRREFLKQLATMIGSGSTVEALNGVIRSLANLSDHGDMFIVADALWGGIETTPLSYAQQMALFEPLLQQVKIILGERSKPLLEPVVLGAIRLAARGPVEEFLSPLTNLSSPNTSSEVQHAALIALCSLPGNQGVNATIERWPSLSPRRRTAILEVLFRRKDGLVLAAQALSKGRLQFGELTASQRDRLVRSTDNTVRRVVGDLPQTRTNENREEIIKQYSPSLHLSGDRAKGKAHFLQRCLVCHRAGGEGGTVGPDLASVRSNGKELMLRNLLDPNSVVPPQFAAYEIQKSDDESIVGIITNETTTQLQIVGSDGKDVTIPRSSIKSMRALAQSLMPEGLESGMSSQDMADLLEFLIQGTPNP